MATRTLTIKAHAKVNLGLRVLARRPDGYHEIDTVMQSVDLHDTLTLERRAAGGISFTSPDLGIPVEDNLAYKAARLLDERVGLPQGVHITLKKRIPVGGGLGGGSSDAAAVLLGLNSLFSLGVDPETLHSLAQELGSDVPFFLQGGRCRARGRGDRIEPVPLPSSEREVLYGLLVPPFSLGAREAYEAWDRLRPDPLDSPYPNDLEAAALALRPELRTYREFLRALPWPFGLSGSGPTYFVVLKRGQAPRFREEAERAFPEARIFLCRATDVGVEIVSPPFPSRA